jgi:uncharacterized protein
MAQTERRDGFALSARSNSFNQRAQSSINSALFFFVETAMQDDLKFSESSRPRFFLFRLPRAARVAIYLPFIAALFFVTVRQLEHAVTYHPQGYTAGPRWTPPANGEDVWINVTNDALLHAWFVRATAQPALATVLYFHGNGGNITHTGWRAAELAAQGFDVLTFDYRGFGRSDGVISDESGLYADGDAAYDYLVRERGVKPEQLVLYGLSLGTTVAIDVAARRPCGALIVESGLSSASEMGQVALPWLPRWLHFLGKNRFDSAHKIANVKCPVLITHGTNDRTVPVAQGRRLYEAAPEPKRLLIIEGGGHNLAGEGGATYRDQIADFAKEALTKITSPAR